MARPSARTHKILQILEQTPVGTQAELVAALRKVGVKVTQATISRDIKRLGLVKVPVNGSRYRYVRPEVSAVTPADAERRLRTALEEFGTGVDVAMELILVKTVRGGAAPVAQAIDDARWPDVAGTIAGEDTILLVPRRRGAVQPVAERLRKLLP